MKYNLVVDFSYLKGTSCKLAPAGGNIAPVELLISIKLSTYNPLCSPDTWAVDLWKQKKINKVQLVAIMFSLLLSNDLKRDSI